MLAGQARLSVLDMRHCALSLVSPPPLPALSSLLVTGNPWVCDCRLAPLLSLLARLSPASRATCESGELLTRQGTLAAMCSR